MGCGSGNDAGRLAREGFGVTALDFSTEAIEQARGKYGASVHFMVADMGLRLPFVDAAFDAVMSNVALHMFDDTVTRAAFSEVARVVRPGGVFLLHVNATEDRPLRARWRPIARELEQDHVLEETGQTIALLLRGVHSRPPPGMGRPEGRTGRDRGSRHRRAVQVRVASRRYSLCGSPRKSPSALIGRSCCFRGLICRRTPFCS